MTVAVQIPRSMSGRPTSSVLVRALAFALVLALTAPLLVMAADIEPEAQQTGQPADAEISNAVALELLFDQGVPEQGIDVETEDGIVTLSGSVSSLMERERAAQIAETVRGVRSVIDEIEVNTPVRSDEEIVDDVEKQFATYPVTGSWDVAVTSDNGMVTLTGTVSSWQEKQLASRLAEEVRGVTDVQNDIVVRYEEERPDAEIRDDIVNDLAWDLYVDNAMISVAVDEGHAMLTGTVGSAAEKSRAIADAWVAGVTSVNADGLVVAGWARDTHLRAGKYELRTDAEIVNAVSKAYAFDPRLNAYRLTVESDGGIVTLNGTVGTLAAKRAAAEDARNTVGVFRVRNLIAVMPKNVQTDEVIAQDVQSALARNPYLDRYDVAVSVQNGVVTLGGEVRTVFEKGEADHIASRISGVADVTNDIKVVNPTFLMTSPYVSEWYLTDLNWHPELRGASNLADWEIERNIQNEFQWSPFVNVNDVTVSVKDGVATLTGTVGTPAEKTLAEANAYQGGATYVDNQLAVGFGPQNTP
jgi:osmotically-inducible protein OsmY